LVYKQIKCNLTKLYKYVIFIQSVLCDPYRTKSRRKRKMNIDRPMDLYRLTHEEGDREGSQVRGW
jgi:hypothetical protein